MSFLPGSFFAHHHPSSSPASSFTPLFRLLDDFESYSRNPSNSLSRQSATMKSFNPKFDVREAGEVYELHGEFPGIDQKDIEIEFTDATTLTIRGRTERSYSSGPNTPAAIEGEAQAKPALTEGETAAAEKSSNNHQATVEDEDANKTTDETPVATPATTNSELSKPESASTLTPAPKEPESRLWVSERTVGEFQRSFTFPVRVDQDAVTATMKNGVLSVVVPKAKKIESRRIPIA